MEIVEYGLAKVLLPHIEEGELRTVDDLGGPSTTDFRYADRSVRHLAVADAALSGGTLTRIEARRATFDQAMIQSVVFDQCVVLSSDWIDCTLARVKFRDCKILGGNFVDNNWSNVVFERCRLEYLTFDSIRTNAPVVFVDSRLKEVIFRRTDLAGGHMSACALDDVEFDGGSYTNFDVRGNDLSTVRGASNLNGVIIDPIQRQELGEALVSELDLRYLDPDNT
ncbi:pentapeptide repeat-containing protein [Kribbella sp. NPDC004536]|uniref:pentapeptide repeat-containing protein n=1 Tax=Kribbella sp. NPDC004536 TaxID=3364106 RepID=UPI0036C79C4F